MDDTIRDWLVLDALGGTSPVTDRGSRGQGLGWTDPLITADPHSERVVQDAPIWPGAYLN